MPDVDVETVRREIPIEQVLDVLGFQPSTRSGVQRKLSVASVQAGPSPLVLSEVALGCSSCHGCRSHGNSLELGAAATKRPLHQAAIDRCHRLGRDVPWIRRW